jgi:hypothetical protein
MADTSKCCRWPRWPGSGVVLGLGSATSRRALAGSRLNAAVVRRVMLELVGGAWVMGMVVGVTPRVLRSN